MKTVALINVKYHVNMLLQAANRFYSLDGNMALFYSQLSFSDTDFHLKFTNFCFCVILLLIFR